MDQPRKKSAAEEMAMWESYAKLVEADKDLKANEDQIVADVASMTETVKELERQRKELMPTSETLARDAARFAHGRTVLERELNRRDAEQTIAQKKAVDRAIIDLKLRMNEINDAVAQLEKALSQLRGSRATLAVHMAKLKEVIGDDRTSGYSAL